MILAYVTVPSVSSYPESARDGNGVKASAGGMADLLKRYTVREVVLVSPSRLKSANATESVWSCPKTRLTIPRIDRSGHLDKPPCSTQGSDRMHIANLFGSGSRHELSMPDETPSDIFVRTAGLGSAGIHQNCKPLPEPFSKRSATVIKCGHVTSLRTLVRPRSLLCV